MLRDIPKEALVLSDEIGAVIVGHSTGASILALSIMLGRIELQSGRHDVEALMKVVHDLVEFIVCSEIDGE